MSGDSGVSSGGSAGVRGDSEGSAGRSGNSGVLSMVYGCYGSAVSDLTLLLRKEFMEVRDGLDPFVEIFEVEFFVWRVQVVAVETEAHEDDLYPQLFFEQRADRDAAAAADGDRGFVERRFDGFGGGLVGFAVDGGHVRFTAVVLFRFDGDAFGGDAAE